MSFVKMQRKRCWQWPFVITTIEPRRDRAKLQYTLYIYMYTYIYIILSSFTFEKSVVFLSCAIFLALSRSGLPPGRFCFDGRVFLVIFLLFVILLRWVESWWNPQQEELLETETQVSGTAKSKDETKELAEMPKSLAKSLDNVCSHYPWYPCLMCLTLFDGQFGFSHVGCFAIPGWMRSQKLGRQQSRIQKRRKTRKKVRFVKRFRKGSWCQLIYVEDLNLRTVQMSLVASCELMLCKGL